MNQTSLKPLIRKIQKKDETEIFPLQIFNYPIFGKLNELVDYFTILSTENKYLLKSKIACNEIYIELVLEFLSNNKIEHFCLLYH